LAQRGSLPPRERHPAAQRREPRPAPPAREPEQDQASESGPRAAAEKTAAVERQIKTLDEMLTSVLPLTPPSFESLMVSPNSPRFDPGPLAPAVPAPAWDDYAPVRPGWLRLLFGGRGRYSHQLATARTRFEAAQSDHRLHESQRRQALAAAKAQHDRQVTEERAKAASHNADIAARQSAFAAGEADAVEWFVARVLDASRYPAVFPREHRVAYRPGHREVEVEFEFPPPRIVPPVRAFRYLRTRDVIEPLPRPESELRQRYQRLISAITLRTLHEVFGATPPGTIRAVAFNGRVSTVDPATGRPARPHLLSVSADRAAFGALVLAAVDPTTCLTHLGARMSASPFDLEPVDPLTAFDPTSYPAPEAPS
jgi:restriction system protein